jgi:hypothetical protein
VSNRGVASHAADLAGVADVAGEVRMAADAILFKLRGINGTDTDRLREVLQREFNGMIPAIIGFCDPFSEKAGRRMTVVANGAGMMGGL